MVLEAVEPALRRQHQIGGSARSLLLTVLGEFALPAAEPVWTSVIVDVLGILGVEEKASRQALARVAADGWLASERLGRRVRWSLTEPGHRLLSEGADRIYSFAARRADWDGRWLVLVVSVPETRREVRHRLRTRLSWAGFGSPAPGLWVCPDAGRQGEAADVLDVLDLSGQALSYTATFAGIGSEQSMVDRAWDLAAIAGRYRAFLAEFGRSGRTSLRRDPDAALLAQIRLVHEWRRFPFLDPQLPATLLPARWAGTRAAEVFRTRHAAWRQAARDGWITRQTLRP